MKKIFKALLFILVCGILITGCSSSNKNSEPQAKHLVFADTQTPTTLDPAIEWDGWFVSRYGIGESLYRLDENFKPQPVLAKDFKNVDKNTWEITLKDNINFSNGNKVTADSVKKSLEAADAKNERVKELLAIESIKAEGQVITIKTTTPIPSFINNITDPLFNIVDTSASEQFPVCTGPFVPTEFKEDEITKVKRNDKYWGEKAKLDTADFRIIPNGNSLSMAVQSGEVDVALNVPAADHPQFRNNDKFKIVETPASRASMVYINFQNKLLADPNLRKAMSMSVDRENMAKVLSFDATTPADGIFPSILSFGGGKKLKNTYGFDINAAKSLLESSGYKDTNGDGIIEKDGVPVTLKLITYSTRPELPVFSEAMQSNWKQLGIDVKIDVLESTSKVMKSGDFDLSVYSFTMAPAGDPQYFSELVFKGGGSNNFGKYNNEKTNKLVEELGSSFENDQRNKTAVDIQQQVYDDTAFMFLTHSKVLYVTSSKVQNFTAYPSDVYTLDAKVDVK